MPGLASTLIPSRSPREANAISFSDRFGDWSSPQPSHSVFDTGAPPLRFQPEAPSPAVVPQTGSSVAATPQSSMADLLMDHIRRQKQHDAERQSTVFDIDAPPVPFVQFGGLVTADEADKSKIRRLSSPLLGMVPR